MEVSESLEDALRREVFEETGLAVAGHELFCVFSDPSRIIRYPDGNVVRIISFVFRVEVESFGTLRRSEESEELRFVEPEELKELDIIETARPIIREYLSRGVSRIALLD